MLIVAGAWMVIAHLAALPYVWSGLGFIDALFESMSGLTTTGATIFTDFSAYGRGIFFWRSMTQWVGGMGVIALFVAVLPRLAVGGREIFFAEASGTDRREADAPDSPDRPGALAAVRGAHRRAGPGAVARRHDPLRRRVPLDDHARGGRVLAAPGIDCRLSEPGNRMDRDRLHVRRRRELRLAVPPRPRKRSCLLRGRGNPRLRRRRRRGDGAPGVLPDVERDTGRRRGAAWPLPDGVHPHHDGFRQRRLQPVERPEQDGPPRPDVHRRVRGLGGRRPQGRAPRPHGAASRSAS